MKVRQAVLLECATMAWDLALTELSPVAVAEAPAAEKLQRQRIERQALLPADWLDSLLRSKSPAADSSSSLPQAC